MKIKKIEQLNDTTYKLIPNDNEFEKFEIEVGDIKQPDFKPQVKLLRWDNECNFSVRAIDDEDGEFAHIKDGDKIKLIKNKIEYHFYEDGRSFEFEVILKEKPKTNKVQMSIETKGLKFFYQPELTEEETGVASATEMFVNKKLDFVLKENPTSVLDLGGGKGQLVKELNNEGIQAVNFDSSQEAYNNRVTDDFIQGDILDGLPFEDNSFDLITGFGFLKYIPDDKIDFVLKEIERVGKRGLFGVGFSDYQPSDSVPIVNNNGRTFWLDKFSSIGSFEVKIFDLIHQKAFRPENIVGSYAVYHSTKQGDYHKIGGKNYMAGKAFHIYRPCIIDSIGKEVWGKLNIDIESKLLTVEIPQEFLDNAVYPIRHSAGLLFGWEGTGGSEWSRADDELYGSMFTTPADTATGISMSIWTRGGLYGGSNLKGVLVLHSNLNIVTNGITDSIIGGASSSYEWKTASFGTAPTITPSTEYVLMWISDKTFYLYYDTGDAGQGHEDSTNDYISPTNPTDAVHSNRKYFIYCTYTAAAGPTPVDVEKAMAYEVVAEIGIEKGLEYTVKTDHDITKGLTYTIQTTASHDIEKSLGYAIKTSIAIEKSLAYEIKTEIGIEKGLDYEIVSPTDIEKGMQYTVITTPAEKTKGLVYTILTIPADIEKGLEYAVITTPASIEKGLQYAIELTKEISKGIEYAIKTEADITKGLEYQVTADKEITKDLEYKIQTEQEIQKSLGYAIKTYAEIQRALEYEIKTENEVTKSLGYAIITSEEKQIGLEYQIISLAEIQKSLAYAIKVEKEIEKTLDYLVTATLEITKALEYTIKTENDIQKTLEYRVTTQQEIQKGLEYRIVTDIYKGDYEDTNYDTYDSALMGYDGYADGIIKTLEYVVTPSQVDITKTIQYAIIGPVEIQKSLAYILQVNPYCSKTTPYSAKDKYDDKDSPYSKFPNKC